MIQHEPHLKRSWHVLGMGGLDSDSESLHPFCFEKRTPTIKNALRHNDCFICDYFYGTLLSHLRFLSIYKEIYSWTHVTKRNRNCMCLNWDSTKAISFHIVNSSSSPKFQLSRRKERPWRKALANWTIPCIQSKHHIAGSWSHGFRYIRKKIIFSTI